MGFFSKKLKDQKETQIVAKDLVLDELLSPEIMKELREKFSDDMEIIPSSIKFQIISKQPPVTDDGKKQKGIQIVLTPTDFVSLEHPSPGHYEGRVIVITSNKNSVLKKFLE